MRARWAAVAAVILLLACNGGPEVAIVGPDGMRRATVAVEIADSLQKREVGLMFRKELATEAGMLFVFAAPSEWSFWMKNTEIPLDMIFADTDGRVVGIVAGAEPYSERPLGVAAPSQYVLEVNGGFCKRHAIKPGDRFEFRGFSPHALN